MNIAIIPARKKSKRVPKKNIKLFNGKPMIYWSIKAALNSKLFQKVIVSTDDKKIASISKKFGAEVPFIRPINLSSDHVSTTEVVAHAIRYLDRKNTNYKFVCCIYPTSPFINFTDIQKGFKEIKTNKYNFVFSASKNYLPILRSFTFYNNKGVKMTFPKYTNYRTQDLSNSYIDAGQFYWGKKEAWLKKLNIFNQYSNIILVPRERFIDIDTKDDWEFAKKMLKF